MKIKLIYFLLLFFIPDRGVEAQEVNAMAELDTNYISIGGQLHLNLSFTAPLKTKVLWPDLIDTIINKVEILEKTKIDTSRLEGSETVTLSQTFKITSFDSGYYVIPPFEFVYRLKNDTTKYSALTGPILINVLTIDVDTTKAIKQIKAPMDAPVTFKEILPYLIIGIIVLALILFLVYFFIKRKKKEPLFKFSKKPELPAHVKALQDLESLRNRKLWQSGKVKEFHSILTDIVRVYIENRFGVQAVEMTTYEILNAFKNLDVDEKNSSGLKQMLELADLVKFAKQRPLPLEHDRSIKDAIDFVTETIPILINNKAIDNN